jgi:hypothetical protein
LLGSARPTGPVAGSTLWSRKTRGGGCLLAVVVILGWVRVRNGMAWDYAHHTQVATIVRVLDECNSPSLVK